MSKALNDLLERLRKHDDPKVKEWHGRLNYTSPRMAEAWNVPDRQMKFETGGPADAARKMMSEYCGQILEEQGLKTPEEIFADRKNPALAQRRQNPNESRLTPFEQAFRIDREEMAAAQARRKKRGLWSRLFGRK